MTVSIPSRRVGDLLITLPSPLSGCIGFHPLKAGRRPVSAAVVGGYDLCFHPLKAGRRLEKELENANQVSVSIPSRRVGDPSAPMA